MGKSKQGGFGVEMKVRVPKEIMDRIDAIAKKRYTTRSEIMRQACLAFVEAKDSGGSGEPDGDDAPSAADNPRLLRNGAASS